MDVANLLFKKELSERARSDEEGEALSEDEDDGAATKKGKTESK